MKYLFFILFFCSCYICQAQNKEYSSHIIKANRFLACENFEEAIYHFDTAFSNSVDLPFYIDLKNYAIACSLLKKEDKFRKAIKEIIISKKIDTIKLYELIPFEYFSLSSINYVRKNYKQWSKQMAIDEYRKSFLVNLYVIDQACRPRRAKYTDREIFVRDSIDELNFHKYMKFVESNGFPDENNIGYQLTDSTNIWDIQSLLFRHFIQSGSGDKIVVLLRREYKKGKLPPQILANVLDLNYHNSKENKKEELIQNTYLLLIGAKKYRPLIDYSEKSLNQINSNRIAIGMDSLHISMNNFLFETFSNENIYKDISLCPYSIIDHLPYAIFGADDIQAEIKKYELDIDYILTNHCR